MKNKLLLLFLLIGFKAISQGCSSIPLNSTINQRGYAVSLTNTLNSSAVIDIQNWQYIVITKDNVGGGKLYKNGQLLYSGSYQNLSFSWNKIILGCVFYTTFNGFFKGWIDEIRMSNTVLSDQDVLTNYNANQAFTSNSNTIGLWHFDQSAGTTVNASVGTAGTITNATWDANGKFGSCLYYNGINARTDILQSVPTSNMSFEFWIKPEVNQVDKWAISWYGGNTAGFVLNTDTTTTYYVSSLITQDTLKACEDSVLLSATPGLISYLWNTGATSSSIYAKSTGWYNVKTTNANGCKGYDSIFVSIVKANIINNDTTICLGTLLTLNAQQKKCNQSYLSSNLQSGLVCYYPFCGNALDMSGNGNNGTVNGASLSTDRFGNANSAYSFNGTNNFISVNHNSNLNLTSYNSFTISTWVYQNVIANYEMNILSKGQGNGANSNDVFIYSIYNTNKLGLELANYPNAFWVKSNDTLKINQWNHLVVTYDKINNISKFYINGVFSGQFSYPFIPTSNNDVNSLYIGKQGYLCNCNYMNGKIDDVILYNHELSNSEVLQLFQLGGYGNSYLWSTGATTPSINVTPSQTTKYWVQVSNGISSCTDTVTITVQNPSAPTTSNIAYCQGTTASALTATSAATSSLRWYTTATGGTFTTTAPTPSTNTVGATTYYVSQITPQGCESARATLTVTINPLPQATISANKAPVICTGDSVVYTVSPQVAGQTYTWYKNGVVIAGATGSYAAKQSGVYSVQVFNSFGCSTISANSSLSVYPWPTVNAGPDKEVPAGTSVDIITQTTNAQSIAWSPVTGLSCISCASPTATVNFPIVYVVTVTSAGGCSVSDTIAIRLVCEDNLLYMPNTFTPNGDGENDRFYPMGKGLGEVNVFRIVNRLGQVVYTKINFSANDASYGWDGTFNGADLGMDVYSYYIEVNCATGQVLKRTGDISLLR